MIPTEFPQCTHVLTSPDSLPLSVFIGNDTEDKPVVISCWKLSKEDLEEIQKTGKIYLQVHGKSQPPVCLFTENPFE